MKLFALLTLVGFVAASAVGSNQLKWRPGTEYHFEYDGRLLTGLPELASHYSGVGLKAKVVVKVNSQNKLGLHVTGAKYARINDELHGDGSEVDKNWRVINLPSFVEVPEEHKKWFATPVVFEYARSTGIFEKLHVSQDEPEWSVNFKKALISIFHLKYEEDSLGGIENKIVSDDESSSGHVDYWKTREMSLDGMCDVTYQINELPAYMVRENNRTSSYSHSRGCPQGSKYYGIVKTRDVASCSRRTAFAYYKPGFFRCTTGNCEGMWSRSSMTRYVTCGTGRDDMRIQSVVNEGELHQNLLGFKTEKFLTGTLQELRLVDEKTYGGGELDYPKNPVVLKDLYFEYLVMPSISTDGLPSVGDLNTLQKDNLLITNPRNMRRISRRAEEGTAGGFEPQRLVPEIKELYKQIINDDLVNYETIADKQINMKALGIARGFTVLNRTTIEHIYEDLKSQFSHSEEKRTVFRNVFFDTLVMGGANSNVQFVKEKILSGELTKTQIISFFTHLPRYVYTPTRGLLKSIFELVTSEKIKQKSYLYNHAIMSYTTLLQKACIADNRKESYPTYVYGEFCNPDSDVVVNTWIPYLQRELNQASTPEKRNLIIVTLGMMSHKNVIPALIPYVENYEGHNNRDEADRKYSPLNRMLAIYSLARPGQKHPELVLPLLFSVYSNPAERYEVRIAAFNTIMRTEPSMTVFHKIAASTWREKDNSEVLKTVNTAFYTLSRQQSLDSVEVTGSTLPRKAWLVYPLIKKTYGEFPTSASLYVSEYLRTAGIGYRKNTVWVDAKDSLLPGHIYSRLTYYMDRYQFTPLEFGFTTRGVENLMRQIIEMIEPESANDRSDENESGESVLTGRLREEWGRALNKLNVRGHGKKHGSDEYTEAAFYVNLFEESPMFFSFQSSSARALREKVGHMLGDASELRSLVRGEEKKFEYQTVFDLNPAVLSIPSDMGLPIIVEVHQPTTVSLSGKMKANLASRSGPSMSMEFKNTFASQLTGWVGTICPFTEEFSYTGIEKHTVINFPVDFHLEVDVPEHKLKLKMKPFASGPGSQSSGRPVDIMTYAVRPFTVRHKIYNLKPMTLENECKTIKSKTPMVTKSYDFGERMGLSLRSSVSTESEFTDFRTVVQKLANANYNPMNLLHFGWINGALNENGENTFRRHKVRLSYDPSTSSTKEIEFGLQYSYGSKDKDQEVKIHELEVEEKEGILPYRVAARALNELKNEERRLRYNNVAARLVNGEYDSGKALNIKYTTVFKGESNRQHRTIAFNLYLTHGLKALKEKWNIHLEDDNKEKSVCIDGHVAWPSETAVWDVEKIRRGDFQFKYENEIGYGRQCADSKIKIEGTTRTSERQRDYANNLYNNNVNRNRNIKSSRSVSALADSIRRKYTTLDEVDFVVKYENVPNQVMVIPRTFIHYLRSVWWSHIDPRVESEQQTDVVARKEHDRVSGTGKYKIRFDERSSTFNLTIHRYDNQMTRFEHVPLPYPLSYMYPLSAVRGHGGHAVFDVFTGGKYSFHPTCKVEDNWIKTFDNSSEELKIDDCFHLLAGDCTKAKTFAVMVKKSSGSGYSSSSEDDSSDSYTKEVKVILAHTDIRMKPSSSSSDSGSDIKVFVDGQEVEMSQDSSRVIKDTKGRFVAELLVTDDRVTVLKSRWVDVKFDGQRLIVEASYLIKNKVCGLCGEPDLDGYSGQCAYTKPVYRAANYRMDGEGSGCKPLPVMIKEEKEREERMCSRMEEAPTKIRGSFDSQTGGNKCARHVHQIYDDDSKDRYCFSRLPITECGPRCRPTEFVEKKVAFHCMPKSSRVAERYADKVREGRVLPELESLKKSYTFTMEVPKSCAPTY